MNVKGFLPVPAGIEIGEGIGVQRVLETGHQIAHPGRELLDIVQNQARALRQTGGEAARIQPRHTEHGGRQVKSRIDRLTVPVQFQPRRRQAMLLEDGIEFVPGEQIGEAAGLTWNMNQGLEPIVPQKDAGPERRNHGIELRHAAHRPVKRFARSKMK
jgi:hypothetical protein